MHDIGRTTYGPRIIRAQVRLPERRKSMGVHNLLRGHISVNHALPHLLGKDVAKLHPDWFPAFSGRPFDPETWKGQLPHPVFTNPDAAHKVAGDAIAYFDNNPHAYHFKQPGNNALFGDLETYEGLWIRRTFSGASWTIATRFLRSTTQWPRNAASFTRSVTLAHWPIRSTRMCPSFP
jgi:hypothetical protein